MANAATFCGRRNLRERKAIAMLMSGNGRHRKPRQAPTAVVAVAATGAGLALPLFAASGAQAADSGTWNAVASCESGGLWSSNTGNGFYGGLQITQETWDLYGGEQYAARPDLASISEQIAVAEKILAGLGPDAWPGCADKAGLTGLIGSLTGTGSATPSTGTGAGSGSDTASPSPTGGADGTATPSAGSSDSASPSTSADGTPATGTSGEQSAQPSDTPSGAASTPTTEPQGSAPSEAPATAPTEGVAESAWGALTRDAGDPSHSARTYPAPSQAPSGRPVTYRVREGDTLCGIAAENGLTWRELYHANQGVIGDDPNVIHPGEYLHLGR
jgi:LysM repeat protein